jgi:hypothetical protein
VQESERLAIEILPIFGQAPASVEPGDGAFDDPSFGQYDEGMQFVALNDFDDPVAALGGCQRSTRSAITRVCEDACDEREQSSRMLVEDEGGPVPILDIGRMHRGAQQQAERIYENVALLALDLLSRIVAMRIDARPPFSALFTLWLSMIAAEGLASRSSRSLHLT